MKKKRFVKLLMSTGYSRDRANLMAGLIPVTTIEVFGKTSPMTFARSWDAIRAFQRVKALAAEKRGEAAES